MPISEGILALLDSRSFGSIWFWVVLVLIWTMAGRRIVGVPSDVISAARQVGDEAGSDPRALRLLDWLSLTLPRWQIAPREGAVLLGLGTFLLSCLIVLGFVYALEMAQAMVLLILPLALIFVLDLRLAAQLTLVLHAAEAGQPVNVAAAKAVRLMQNHRYGIMALSVLSVALTAFYGALWMMAHPFGF